MDLVNRDVLALHARGRERQGSLRHEAGAVIPALSHAPERGDALGKQESKLVEHLFDTMGYGADSFTFVWLKDAARSRPRSFNAGMDAWRSAVRADASQRGLLERDTSCRKPIVMIIGMIAFFFSCFILMAGWPGCAGIADRVSRRHRHLRDVALHGPPQPGGRRAARPVRGARALPGGLRPTRREASGVDRSLGALPCDRGRLRHRRQGGRAASRRRTRDRLESRHRHDVVDGLLGIRHRLAHLERRHRHAQRLGLLGRQHVRRQRRGRRLLRRRAAVAEAEEVVALASYFPNDPADTWRRAKPFVAVLVLLFLCPLCACSLWLVGLVGE